MGTIGDISIDLAICVSLISSLENFSVSSDICFSAKVGSGEEIRAVQRIEQRISERCKTRFPSDYRFKIQYQRIGFGEV